MANQTQLLLFTEKFEHMVEEYERKMETIAKGVDPYKSGFAEGKYHSLQSSFNICECFIDRKILASQGNCRHKTSAT